MKNKILSCLLGWFFAVLLGFWWFLWNYVNAENWECNGIKLNTNFPIIWNCIETKAGSRTDPTNAFPTMIWALTKIVMSIILVVCFILIIYAGILWSANKPTDAKKWIKTVAITILLLWSSGVILKLVNPNFFG